MADLDGEGAGALDAGDGLAGSELTDNTTPRERNTAVPAPLFDPLTRRYQMNSDGTLVAEHWVIAKARHSLGIRRRGIPAAKNLGIPIGRVRVANRETRLREAQDAVALALKVQVDAGELAILRVYLSEPWNGTFYTEIQNLLAPNDKPSSLTATLARD